MEGIGWENKARSRIADGKNARALVRGQKWPPTLRRGSACSLTEVWVAFQVKINGNPECVAP